MSDLLADLKTFISAGGIDASIIFRDTLPDTPDIAIGLFEYQGSGGVPQIDGVTRPVQISCRHTGATSSKDTAKSIYHILNTDDGIVQLSPTRRCLLSISQPPFRIKVDDKNRVIYGFNIVVTTTAD